MRWYEDFIIKFGDVRSVCKDDVLTLSKILYYRLPWQYYFVKYTIKIYNLVTHNIP